MSNNYVVKDGNGNNVTFISIDTTGTGVQAAQSVPTSPSGTPYSDLNPSSSAVQGRSVTLTDISGTLSTTTKQIAAPNSNRRGFWIQNLDLNNNLYLKFGSTASASYGSILIPPLGIYESPIHMIPITGIYLFGVAGQAYTANQC
jgi:hypothetical protein